MDAGKSEVLQGTLDTMILKTGEEAAAAARRQFGNAIPLRQRQRDLGTFRSLSTLARDLRFAGRQLLRNPLFSSIAIFSLALGIGANTAIFSVAKRVLFDTLPVAHPHELRMLAWVSGPHRPVPPVWGDISSTPDGGLTSTVFSYPVLQALRRHPNAFSNLIAFKDVSLTATFEGTPEVLSAELLSGGAFDGLGVEPILGRTLAAADLAGFHLALQPGDRGLDQLSGAFARPSYILLALSALVSSTSAPCANKSTPP